MAATVTSTSVDSAAQLATLQVQMQKEQDDAAEAMRQDALDELKSYTFDYRTMQFSIRVSDRARKYSGATAPSLTGQTPDAPPTSR